MITLQNIPGRTTIIDGKEYLFFSGYSYLGLGMLPEFTNLVKQGIDLYGVVYPSSRISNTQLDLYAKMEEELAAFTQTEDAACLSSGFLSARTAVEVVAEQMTIYAFHHTHPASSAMAAMQFIPENQSWEDFLRQRAAANEYRFAVAADSMYITPGYINNFSFLNNTPAYFNITLIVDDSHGIGWLGNEGRGIRSLLALPGNIELLLNFSLSKAFHINGGAVAGSRKWINAVRRHVNYATSTAIIPALAYAFTQAQELFRHQRLTLHQNIEYLQKLTAKHTFVSNEGTPVFVVAKKDIAQHLLHNNIIISSFGYPHPEDNPVNRIVVNALHTKSDLERLVHLLEAH